MVAFAGYTSGSMRRLLQVRSALTLFFFFPALVCVSGSSAWAQTLLVVDQGSATVSLINPASGAIVGTIAENTPGVHAHEIAASADGKTAYLPIYGSSGVGHAGIDGTEMLFLDVPSRTISGRLDFGRPVRPHFPVLNPVDGMLYVTTELDNSVTVIDPKTRKIIATVPTGQPESHMLAISHNGQRGYTANVGPGTVSVLDLPGRKTVTVIHVADHVQRISISNDDRLVFTSDTVQPRLAVIDTATNQVKTFIPLPGLGYGSASTPDGRMLLVAVPAERKVAVVDIAQLKVVRTVDVPPLPQEVLIPPGGHTAYVSCNASGTVAAIDLDNWTAKTFAAGRGADGLGWAK
jgi:YVTN family beta-propeller protein